MKRVTLVVGFLFCALLWGCSKDDSGLTPEPKPQVQKSKECNLKTFGFAKADNAKLIQDAIVQVTSNQIEIEVHATVDVSNLITTFTSSAKSIVKVGGIVQSDHTTANNFTNPITYTVLAEDGTTANTYTVTVKKVAILKSVEPLIKNKWVTFTYPYNIYYPEFTGKNSVNGHVGNACGPTALAKILGHMKYPVNGSGKIDFDDKYGEPVHWTVDLETMNLNYSNMPDNLSSSDPESKYRDVAKLFQATAAVGHYYIIWNRDVYPSLVEAIKTHFKLSSDLKLVNRWEVTRDKWIEILKTELSSGRPVMIAGRTKNSPAPWEAGSSSGHWFNVDGYNSVGEFHVLYNYGPVGSPIQGYFDADNLGAEYIAYNQMIIGFAPKN